MSDNLPFEIQVEIIKKLPVKSLIRFRSVSKSWKSLIDTSDFVANYTSQRQHLLVRYDHPYPSNPGYVSIVDDDSFPRQKGTPNLPPLVKFLKDYDTIGSSHGLLCLYGWHHEASDAPITRRVVIWNPSIRKAVAAVVRHVADDDLYGTKLGFGVCRKTSDPKVVKINYIDSFEGMERVTRIPWQVEVFALSKGEWKSPYGDPPRKSLYFGSGQSVDGACYWLATDRGTVNFKFNAYNMIVSFDMTREEFKEVKLPDNFVYEGSMFDLYISNLRESLVVLERSKNKGYLDVWLMEDGVPGSFTKLYTIYAQSIQEVMVFRKSGDPVVKRVSDGDGFAYEFSSIAIYERRFRHICELGFDGVGSYYVHSYMETLLLHDQPSYTVFDKGIRYIENLSVES